MLITLKEAVTLANGQAVSMGVMVDLDESQAAALIRDGLAFSFEAAITEPEPEPEPTQVKPVRTRSKANA